MGPIKNNLKYNELSSDLSDSQKSRIADILMKKYNTRNSIILNGSLFVYDDISDLSTLEIPVDIEVNARVTRRYLADLLAFIISKGHYPMLPKMPLILQPYNDGGECTGEDFMNIPTPILIVFLKDVGIRFKVINKRQWVNVLVIGEFANCLGYKPKYGDSEGEWLL